MSDDDQPPNPAELSWLAEARAMHGIPAAEPPGKPPADASDPQQAKQAKRQQRITRREQANTVHEMMQVREIRSVIYRWLHFAGAFRPHDFPYGVMIDPLQLARNAAHRELAQLIIADLLGAAPDLYLLMLKEAHEAQSGGG